MKKTLFIGSTVLDMVVELPHLPVTKEDINTKSMKAALGGCSYNASSIAQHLSLPYIHCSPCGEGFFADCVKTLLAKQNRTPFVSVKDIDNGCCLCLVDEQGERTFISHHGAEYLFDSSWLKDIQEEFDFIYVCGLEIEDKNGNELIDTLNKINYENIVFAPGARINKIQPERLKKLLEMHPILHLNDDEALAFTGCDNVAQAAEQLYKSTQNTVIITCGAAGACLKDETGIEMISGFDTVVIDTIGAGDSHVGAWICAKKVGMNNKQAVRFANYTAAEVVSIQGPALSEKGIDKINHFFDNCK